MDWTGDLADIDESFERLRRNPPDLVAERGGCVWAYGLGLTHLVDYYSGVVLCRSRTRMKLGSVEAFQLQGRTRVWDASMRVFERSSRDEAFELWQRTDRAADFDETGYWYRVLVD